MKVYPCAKINLGLNVVEKREDGYHNLETVFYPVPINDTLEISLAEKRDETSYPCELSVDGAVIECDNRKNLVVKAYDILAADFHLPDINVILQKNIPMQAGLGGGSSDAAYMIRLLNEQFNLQLDHMAMERYAARLGADCAFFISAQPSYATGIGDILTPLSAYTDKPEILKGIWIALIKPDVAVSTKEAFSGIKPMAPPVCCRDIVIQPIDTWKENLTNDFEESIFSFHPELADIKAKLYDNGAVYAAMSGSGSTIFGLFREKPDMINALFPDCKTFTLLL